MESREIDIEVNKICFFTGCDNIAKHVCKARIGYDPYCYGDRGCGGSMCDDHRSKNCQCEEDLTYEE